MQGCPRCVCKMCVLLTMGFGHALVFFVLIEGPEIKEMKVGRMSWSDDG